MLRTQPRSIMRIAAFPAWKVDCCFGSFLKVPLEDHVGDVVFKARTGFGLSSADAADAAEMPLSDFETFESTGQGKVDWGRLGALLGLNPAKLERLAGGWAPPPIQLARWREIRQIVTQSEKFSVNNYLVWDEVTREAALFDTGMEPTHVFAIINSESLELKHVFITHSHYDHIEALPLIRGRFPKARLHSGSKNAPPEHRNRPNDFIHLGSLRITHRETPGHCEDGVTYVVGGWPEDAPGVAIVGDAVFAGSIGGAGGAMALAKRMIAEQIFSLPGDTLICPGHGPVTTVSLEKANNPFFDLPWIR